MVLHDCHWGQALPHQWASSLGYPPVHAWCSLQGMEAENALKQNTGYLSISVASSMPSSNFTKLLRIYFRTNLAFKLGG